MTCNRDINLKFKLSAKEDNFIVPSKQYAHIGDSFSIVCYSKSRITWFLNGKKVFSNDVIVMSLTVLYTRLYIKSIEDQHFGTYTCSGIKTGSKRANNVSESRLIKKGLIN